jgi:hypothetical protein
MISNVVIKLTSCDRYEKSVVNVKQYNKDMINELLIKINISNNNLNKIY